MNEVGGALFYVLQINGVKEKNRGKIRRIERIIMLAGTVQQCVFCHM